MQLASESDKRKSVLFDALLDELRRRLEALGQMLNNLLDQLIVLSRLTRFHNTDDHSFDQMFSVFLYSRR